MQFQVEPQSQAEPLGGSGGGGNRTKGLSHLKARERGLNALHQGGHLNSHAGRGSRSVRALDDISTRCDP